MKLNILRFRNVLAVVLFTGALATVAFAHNKLMKTAPAAGATVGSAARVELWFAEKPDVAVTKIAVKGPAGAVDLGPTHASSDMSVAVDVKGKLGDGPYTVSWQTSGDDGHVSKGDFSFNVKSTQ